MRRARFPAPRLLLRPARARHGNSALGSTRNLSYHVRRRTCGEFHEPTRQNSFQRNPVPRKRLRRAPRACPRTGRRRSHARICRTQRFGGDFAGARRRAHSAGQSVPPFGGQLSLGTRGRPHGAGRKSAGGRQTRAARRNRLHRAKVAKNSGRFSHAGVRQRKDARLRRPRFAPGPRAPRRRRAHHRARISTAPTRKLDSYRQIARRQIRRRNSLLPPLPRAAFAQQVEGSVAPRAFSAPRLAATADPLPGALRRDLSQRAFLSLSRPAFQGFAVIPNRPYFGRARNPLLFRLLASPALLFFPLSTVNYPLFPCAEKLNGSTTPTATASSAAQTAPTFSCITAASSAKNSRRSRKAMKSNSTSFPAPKA